MFDTREIVTSAERARHLADRAAGIQAHQVALDAELAELVLEFELLRATGSSQFRDTEAFLRNATGISRSTAHSRVRAFRQLIGLPTMRQALQDGTVTFDHVRALAQHADSPNRDQVLDREAELTAWALDTPADAYRDRLAVWARDLDEQRLEGMTEPERQRARRRVRRSTTRDGLKRTVLDLDDESDAVVYGALRKIVAEMRRRERDAELGPDQQRTTGQLFADAARELAHRSVGADVITKHRARPVILALTEMSVLWDQLRVNGVCELDNGTQLTGAQLRKMACEADIIPIVLSGDGVPLDVGRTFRFATYKQRLLLRTLHPTCAVEGCDVHFDDCEIHHLKPWEKGGRTDLDNLVPLCWYHHHWVHELDGKLTMELLPDRTLRLPGHRLTACSRRRNPLVERLKHPPDPVPTRP